MKKLFTILTVLVFIIVSGQSLKAQESEMNGSKFGLGVSLFNYTQLYYEGEYSPASTIYATINLKSNVRIEPTVSFVLSDMDTNFTLGVGVFGVKPAKQFNFLYGVRLGYSLDEIMVIAPTIGGEYVFLDRFSIGTEIQIRSVQFQNDWALYTNTSVLFRFYF